MPVADLGGIWSNVQIWHNTITGLGATDRYNPLFEVDKQPTEVPTSWTATTTGTCPRPVTRSTATSRCRSNDWLTLADWQAHNGHGWDADSAIGGFSATCPSGSIR